MTEYGTTTDYGMQTTEICLTRVMNGDAATVRLRLCDALERLGYHVIQDEPIIQARRGARGWGKWMSSADVLEYPAMVTVRLKPLSAFSARATLDYTIKHPWLSDGEKAVVLSEAETLVALASARPASKTCAACGMDATDDSRFCRRCGAPMTGEQAELKLLNMIAETRAAHTSVVTGVGLAMVVLLISVVLFSVLLAKGAIAPGALRALLLVIAGLSASAVFIGACAWSRINRALRPTRKDLLDPARNARQTNTATNFPAGAQPEPLNLSPRQTPLSVTEGTTQSLPAQWNTPAAAPIPVARFKEHDTNGLE